MTEDLRSGRITKFSREQAFGLITLDDGTPVKFDAGICTMVPEEGAAIRARVGPAKWGGGLKALYVEPMEGAPVAAVVRPKSLEDQLAAVQREHLANAFTESIMDEIVAQRFGGQSENGTIAELLDAYYTGDPERAKGDGYLRRGPGLPAETDDVLAELAALLPDVKLPAQVRWTGRVAARAPGSALGDESQVETVPYEKADAEGGAEAGSAALVVRDPDGRERSVNVASLDDVIEVANAALRRAGDGRRIYKLRTIGDWQAYFAFASDRALRLASTLPFSPPPADVR
jgi:hypothetical protein